MSSSSPSALSSSFLASSSSSLASSSSSLASEASFSHRSFSSTEFIADNCLCEISTKSFCIATIFSIEASLARFCLAAF
ncbi:hypothetical protein PGT21_027006 [Puccinia graminis f. sp. tritici]|uniref:Uncharacterized protein n=1 Tax=Puccinia graminis f. sp. tritici TaxID=56615 RepID=A0A5B0PYV2_PUCGR|nr:hypothetical protein PGT21_027006 [Puccinia graminis f. sp. tritici]